MITFMFVLGLRHVFALARADRTELSCGQTDGLWPLLREHAVSDMSNYVTVGKGVITTSVTEAKHVVFNGYVPKKVQVASAADFRIKMMYGGCQAN